MAFFDHEKKEEFLKKMLTDMDNSDEPIEEPFPMSYDEFALYKKAFDWGVRAAKALQ